MAYHSSGEKSGLEIVSRPDVVGEHRLACSPGVIMSSFCVRLIVELSVLVVLLLYPDWVSRL